MYRSVENRVHLPQGRSVVPDCLGAAPFVLTLPKIARGVPAQYVQIAHPSIVLLARRMGEAQLITPDDVAAAPEIDQVIKTVFARELERALGDLKLVHIDAEISDGCERMGYDEQPENDAAPEERFHFGLQIVGPETLVVGEALSALEQLRPGLGETLYAALQSLGDGSLGLFTFDTILEDRPYMYRLEERECQQTMKDMTEEDIAEEFGDLPTRAQLLDGCGVTWANKPQLRLTPNQVREVITDPATPQWARRVLAALLAATDAYVEGRGTLGKLDYWSVQPAYMLAVLRFSENDNIERIYHDHIEEANNCSENYTDMAHVELIDLRDSAQFCQWWDGIVRGCRLVAAIDRLLDALVNANNKE